MCASNNSFVYFSRYATARLILELWIHRSGEAFSFSSFVSRQRRVVFFLSFFSFLFSFSLSFSFLRVPLYTALNCCGGLKILDAGSVWIQIFKEWNDVERICNFAEDVDFENFVRSLLKRLTAYFRILRFFFFNRKENSDFTDPFIIVAIRFLRIINFSSSV